MKVIENVTIRYRAYDFLLMFYCNYGSISCPFQDIQCRKISRPWNPGQSQSRWLNVVLFDRLGTVSYWCSIVTLSLGHTVFDIRLRKRCDLENRVKGPWRSLKISPFDTAHMTSCWRSVVTMALSRVISEIFNVEKYCDLKIPVRVNQDPAQSSPSTVWYTRV